MTKPPAIARSSRTTRLKPARTLFLLKNLNNAPSPYGLEPDAHFVIQLLFENILSNRIAHLFKRRDRIRAACPCGGHKNFIVILADILIRRADELAKSQIEVTPCPHSSQDGIMKSTGRNGFLL